MPDQEMIERVAKIIQDGVCSGDSSWDEISHNVIKAMREPTDKMMNAAIYKGVDCGFGCGYPEYEDVYKATIDSILND